MASQVVEQVGDGRRERRDRNRDAVVDAMLSLYDDGRFAPSSDEIAERAGLSPRSLFRYFDDIDDLVRSSIERQLDRIRPALALKIDLSEPTGVRIGRLVSQRLRLFDAMSPVGVVARLRAPFQPLIAEQLDQVRAFLRDQLRRMLAPELAGLDEGPATSLLAAADVVCSFDAYRLLRFDQSMSRARAGVVLVDTLTRLFADRP